MTLYKTYRGAGKDWTVVVKVTGEAEEKLIRIESAEEIFNNNPDKSVDYTHGLMGLFSIAALLNQRDVISIIFSKKRANR